MCYNNDSNSNKINSTWKDCSNNICITNMRYADHIYTITAVIIISILQWYLEFEYDDLDRYLQ